MATVQVKYKLLDSNAKMPERYDNGISYVLFGLPSELLGGNSGVIEAGRSSEIDTGVSGRAAHKIAYKLREVSKDKQVLCVTHLAQIASGADNHLFIEKVTDETSAYTKVTTLKDEQRVNEIARIIGGDVVTQSTLCSAREMIEFSSKGDII